MSSEEKLDLDTVQDTNVATPPAANNHFWLDFGPLLIFFGTFHYIRRSNPDEALFIAAAAFGANAILDPLLIRALGIAGAAWANVTFEAICFILIWWYSEISRGKNMTCGERKEKFSFRFVPRKGTLERRFYQG